MARLPVPGSDDGAWGTILNDFLSVEHNADGTLAKDSLITGAEQAANKGVANGYASLDGTGKVPSAQLPSSSGVPSSRQIIAGNGLTGGGDLTADRTLAVNFGTGSGAVAQGNDSRITGAVQTSLVNAKGDLIVGTASATVGRLPVGTDTYVLTADSTQSTGVKWSAAASGGSSQVYPLSAYGLFAASESLGSFNNLSTLDQGYFARVLVPAGKAINAIGSIVRTAGTVSGGGLNGFAIYDDTGTLVTSTPDDNTMWQSVGWVFKTLGTPIAAQGSDRFVYVGIASRGYSSVPYIPYAVLPPTLVDGGGYLVTTRRSFYNGINAWPSSFNPATYGLTTTGYLPFVVLA